MISFIVEDSSGTRRLDFDQDRITIGRDSAASVGIEDDLTSRRHAEVLVESSGVWLVDLGSRNGTFRGDQAVGRVLLRRGDCIGVGHTQLTFVGEDGNRREPTVVGFYRLDPDGRDTLYELAQLPATVGRSSSADLILDDPEVSSRHATVSASEGNVVIEDNGSSNGIWRGGQRIRRAVLREGDEISLGDTRLRFAGGEVPVETLPEGFEIPGVSLQERIAVGARCVIWRGRQLTLDRDVVVKVLRPSLCRSRAMVALFQRQTRIQSRVQHPGLARGIDVGESSSLPWFIGEWVGGEDLEQILRGSLGLDPKTVVQHLVDVLSVVHAVHQQSGILGCLHPRRIVVDSEGELRLLSCGFPYPRPRDYPEERCDELAYLAPEAVGGVEEAGPQSDLFSVGALGHFLLSGRSPRDCDSLEEMLRAVAEDPLPAPQTAQGRGVPGGLRQMIEELCSVSADDRPESALAARDRLEAMAGGLGGIATAGVGGAGVRSVDEVDAAALRAHRRKVKRISLWVSAAILVGSNLALFLAWPWIWSTFGPSKKRSAPRVIQQPDVEAEGAGQAEVFVDPVAQARRRAWIRTQAQVEESDSPAEALKLYREFAERNPGTSEATRALRLLGEARGRWKTRVTRALDQFEEAIEQRNPEAARRIIDRARALSRGIEEQRFEALLARLISLEKAVAAGGGGTGKPELKPRPGKKPEPAVTSTPAPKAVKSGVGRLTAALGRPWDPVLRRAALKAAKDLELSDEQRRGLRMLKMLDTTIQSAVSRAAASAKALSFVTKTGRIEGTVVGFGDEGLDLKTAEGRKTLSVADLGPLVFVSLLEADEATPASYLGRGWLNLKASRHDEAWFDFQGVVLLAAPDSWEAQTAKRELSALGRLKIRPLKPRTLSK